MANFVWNPVKAARNLRRHKVHSKRHNVYSMIRSPSMKSMTGKITARSGRFGMVEDRLLVVTYTLRRGITHIISARLAEAHERRKYHEAKR